MNNATNLQTLSDLENTNTLIVTLLPDEQRIGFWPQHFGSIPQWMTLEPHIFAWMDLFCADYCGGIWQFYTLSNGGAFMAPEANEDIDEKWTLFNPMNGNGGELSGLSDGFQPPCLPYRMRRHDGALLPSAGLRAQPRGMQRHHAHH